MFVNDYNSKWIGEDVKDRTEEKDVKAGKNILETEGGTSSRAGFRVSMDGTSVNLNKGDTFTLTVGNQNIVITADRTGTFTAAQLVEKLAEAANKMNGGDGIQLMGDDGKSHNFTAKVDGKSLVFTVDEDDEDDFSLKDNATVTWNLGGTPSTEDPEVTGQPEENPSLGNGGTELTYSLEGFKVNKPGTYTFTIDQPSTHDDQAAPTQAYTFEVEIKDTDFKADGSLDLESVAGKLADAML